MVVTEPRPGCKRGARASARREVDPGLRPPAADSEPGLCDGDGAGRHARLKRYRRIGKGRIWPASTQNCGECGLRRYVEVDGKVSHRAAAGGPGGHGRKDSDTVMSTKTPDWLGETRDAVGVPAVVGGWVDFAQFPTTGRGGTRNERYRVGTAQEPIDRAWDMGYNRVHRIQLSPRTVWKPAGEGTCKGGPSSAGCCFWGHMQNT